MILRALVFGILTLCLGASDPPVETRIEMQDEEDGFVARIGDKYPLAEGHFSRAIKAYRKPDHAAFRDNMLQAVFYRNDHPTYRYYLAAGHALVGDAGGAAKELRTLAGWGLHVAAATEADFDTVRDDPAVQSAFAALAANHEPRGAAPVAFYLPAKGGLWEGVARDDATGRVFISDLHHGRVWVRTVDGALSPFARIPDAGFGAGGMAVDSPRQRLWVSAPAMPEVAEFKESLAGQSRLIAFDLSTGAVENVVILDDRDDATPHTVVDVTVAADGTVYAADSTTPVVWRIALGSDQAEVFVRLDYPGSRHSLQSCAITADQRWMFVSDYSTGIHRVDLQNGEAEWMGSSFKTTWVGIDGLALVDNTLLAAQNGVTPARLLRIPLVSDQDHMDAPRLGEAEVVAAALPDMADPTLVRASDDGFWVVGDAGWKHFGSNAQPDPANRTVPILQLPVSR